jgi:propanol-preferring alcohol dehydrogenase
MKTMRAYRLFEWQQPPCLVDVPIPEPGPGEVRLKVAGNGLCQSDLHMIHDWTDCPAHLDLHLPQTIGHEIGGWIDKPGPGAEGWSKGLPVLVTLASCGQCAACLNGWNNYCQSKPVQPGIGSDGGLAEYVIAPLACLVPCNGLDPALAAPLTDAGLSSYHAVQRVLSLLAPNTTVVVIGAGGLGHLAISALKACSPSRIIAIDPSPEARQLALDSGADLACKPGDPDLPDHTATAVLDFVGGTTTMQAAADMIRPMGHIVMVGRGTGDFAFNHRSIPYGAKISTTFGGSKSELAELIALTREGKIRPHISRYPLADVDAILQRLADGEIQGRAVIVP